MVQFFDDHPLNINSNYLLPINYIKMKLPWFKRNGVFFVPVSIVGWIIFLIGIVYAIYSFIDIDSRSHSVSDTLINFVFSVLIIGAVYSLIAYILSRSAKNK